MDAGAVAGGLTAAALTFCAACAAYLLILTVAGWFYRAPGASRLAPSNRIAVLIPAHDEESALPHLFESLASNEYPADLYSIFVVADNCSDRTADVARERGATVFERTAAGNRGKGAALTWLLERVNDEGTFDAYAFIDADCTVSRNFLSATDARLQRGAVAIQTHYAVGNPRSSWVAALRYAAIVLMHDTRPRGQTALGLSSGLFGTGMVFHWSVIDAIGWESNGLTEDVEQYLRLAAAGIKVEFAAEASVASAMPASLRGAWSQNLRWERGRLGVALTRAPGLVLTGFVRLAPSRVNAAVEQLVPPLSILGALTAVMSLVAVAASQGITALALAAFSLAALALHLFTGLIRAKAPPRAYAALAFLPLFVAWKVGVYLAAMRPGRVAWVRTERSRTG